jgi:predicted GH43/DUF377 family glycosyl hydrolase
MLYTDESRGRPFAKDPAVVWYGGRFLMYYSIPSFGDGRPGDGWQIGIAESHDLETWNRIGEIDRVAPYEMNGIAAPGAIVIDNKIELYYQTYGNFPNDAICLARSNDGVNFAREDSNPIFSPSGDWNNGRAIDADVVIFGNNIYLYYASRDPSGQIQILGVTTSNLSDNRRRDSWQMRSSQPILAPREPWEQHCIEAPAVLVRNGLFHMFYGGAYNCCPQQIGHAISTDGIDWSRSSLTPLITNGPAGSWNASESGHPYVFEHQGQTHLFYQGSPDGGEMWFLSRILIDWDGDNPIPRID